MSSWDLIAIAAVLLLGVVVLVGVVLLLGVAVVALLRRQKMDLMIAVESPFASTPACGRARGSSSWTAR